MHFSVKTFENSVSEQPLVLLSLSSAVSITHTGITETIWVSARVPNSVQVSQTKTQELCCLQKMIRDGCLKGLQKPKEETSAG